MCFENLPIEFAKDGNAFLKDGIRNPYEYQTRKIEERNAKLKEVAVKNGQLADVDFDPVTRVAGALAFHSTVDLKKGTVLETNAMATLFRGYEVILRGRDPRDAAFISSRACGVCGGVHADAAVSGRAEIDRPAEDHAGYRRAERHRGRCGLYRDLPCGPDRHQFCRVGFVGPCDCCGGAVGRHRFRSADHRVKLCVGHYPAD